MSEHGMGLSKIAEICVHGYESAWLGHWTQLGSEVKSQAIINCSKEINLPEDSKVLNLDFRSKDTEGETKETDQAETDDTLESKRIRLVGSISSKGLRILQGKEKVEKIPDMNKEPLIVANGENSKNGEEDETSSSATQIMNVEHFLNNNTKLFKECKRIKLDPETNSRSQIKRLKTNASDSTGNETKSIIAVKGASENKGNDFFQRILKCGNNKPGSRANQEPSASQIKNLDMGGGGEDITLLNPWIQRWCYKKKAVASNELEVKVNTKGLTLGKQFPSIAAMALMGKAMGGLNRIGLRKTNSLFVWNNQDLR